VIAAIFTTLPEPFGVTSPRRAPRWSAGGGGGIADEARQARRVECDGRDERGGRRPLRSGSRRGAIARCGCRKAVAATCWSIRRGWLANYDQLIIAPGIANIYARDPNGDGQRPARAGRAIGRPLSARPRRLARASGRGAARAHLRAANRDDAGLSGRHGGGAIRRARAAGEAADHPRPALGPRMLELSASAADARTPTTSRPSTPPKRAGSWVPANCCARKCGYCSRPTPPPRAPAARQALGPYLRLDNCTPITGVGSGLATTRWRAAGRTALIDANVAWGDEGANPQAHPGTIGMPAPIMSASRRSGATAHASPTSGCWRCWRRDECIPSRLAPPDDEDLYAALTAYRLPRRAEGRFSKDAPTLTAPPGHPTLCRRRSNPRGPVAGWRRLRSEGRPHVYRNHPFDHDHRAARSISSSTPRQPTTHYVWAYHVVSRMAAAIPCNCTTATGASPIARGGCRRCAARASSARAGPGAGRELLNTPARARCRRRRGSWSAIRDVRPRPASGSSRNVPAFSLDKPAAADADETDPWDPSGPKPLNRAWPDRKNRAPQERNPDAVNRQAARHRCRRFRRTHPQQAAPGRRPTRDEALGRRAHPDPLGRRRPPAGKACSAPPSGSCARTRNIFSGYVRRPVALLQRTFEETDGYDEIVLLKDIRFESFWSTTSGRSSARCTSPICPTPVGRHLQTGALVEVLTPNGCRSRKR